jgi:integrase
MQAEVSQKTRRTLASKKDRGIYYRDTPTGRRYEITYTDSTGKQRWQVVEGGITDARAARGEILSKLVKGERVVPSKATLAEYAAVWLATQDGQLRPSTHRLYKANITRHVLPLLGRRQLASVSIDDVAALVADLRRAGLSGYTIKGILTPLGRMFASAVRRGLIPGNPVAGLDRSERPRGGKREQRILGRDEIGRLLASADAGVRTLLATAVFTGLRQGELLGLRWGDLDLEAGVIRVRGQLGRDGEWSPFAKTQAGLREVVLMPALGRLLREQRERAFGLGYARPEHYVFASSVGTPLHFRNVARRALDPAMDAAGLTGEGRGHLRWHDLRHCFASILISQGHDVVYVSRQLGHSSPSVTLDVYSHLFDGAEHAERARDALEAGFGSLL